MLLESETDFFASFLASTCAVTIGLNLNWPTADYASVGEQRLQQVDCGTTEVRSGCHAGARNVLYVVAGLWAQVSGSLVRAIGPCNLMTCGLCASACAGLVLTAFNPCHAVSAYGASALQGFGCASLAVAVPNYIVTHVGRRSRGVMLCLIEVFTLVGALIAHALSVLVTPDQLNIWSTSVILLNVMALLLICVTTTTDSEKYCRMSESALLCGSVENDPLESEQKKYDWVSGIKRYLFTENLHRRNVQIAVVLFAFRDFSGVYMFEKIILHLYNLLNAGPVPYRPCAFLLTTLQVILSSILTLNEYKLMFTIPAVVAIGFCGERKLLLISSFGMYLSMTVLGMVNWNNSHAFVIAAAEDNSFYLVGIAIVFLSYIAFFSQGLGSIPWALQFQIIDRKIRDIATGMIISAHFIFLMITEDTYTNDMYSELSIVAYWFMFVCFLQISFVYYFVLK